MKKYLLLVILSGCAGWHPPVGMPLDNALKISTICRNLYANTPVLSTDLFGASTFLGFGKSIVTESQLKDCVAFYGFNNNPVKK